jgi:hypothetical protein
MLATDLMRRAVPWTELMLRQRRMVNDLNLKTHQRISVVLAFALLGTLAASWPWPPALIVGTVTALLLLALNVGLVRFFLGRRGALFTLGVLPMHWLYLLICGIGAGLGLVRYLVDRGRPGVDPATERVGPRSHTT